jgi:DNA-3-methyladenine glycosylase II
MTRLRSPATGSSFGGQARGRSPATGSSFGGQARGRSPATGSSFGQRASADWTPTSLTPEAYQTARRVLMRRDPVLGAAIKTIGPCGMADRQRKDHLGALVGAIVSQQLSTKAAATIFGRFVALFPDNHITDAAAIAAKTDPQLRAVGLSGQKVSYLRDLSARLLDGRLNLDELDALPDEAVIERLTAVKGFGRWTAEMFLMFRLHRPDVLPVGDLGIVNAIQRLYKLRKRPDAKRILKIGDAWRPYRSVASWYLWQTLRNTPLTNDTPKAKLRTT